MTSLGTRLTRLEAAQPSTARWHRVVQMPGATRDDALDHHGRHLIAPGGNIVIRRVVETPRVRQEQSL